MASVGKSSRESTDGVHAPRARASARSRPSSASRFRFPALPPTQPDSAGEGVWRDAETRRPAADVAVCNGFGCRRASTGLSNRTARPARGRLTVFWPPVCVAPRGALISSSVTVAGYHVSISPARGQVPNTASCVVTGRVRMNGRGGHEMGGAPSFAPRRVPGDIRRSDGIAR